MKDGNTAFVPKASSCRERSDSKLGPKQLQIQSHHVKWCDFILGFHFLVQKLPKTKKQEVRKLRQPDTFQAQQLLLKFNCQNQSQNDRAVDCRILELGETASWVVGQSRICILALISISQFGFCATTRREKPSCIITFLSPPPRSLCQQSSFHPPPC